ncbi:MAG: hypothetical protein NTU45_06495 [Planctomycetota bacterium]|nr:hypothetical protein [Planctomycetota bacterium]
MMAALASQKDNLTVYLMSVYGDKAERAWFEKAWKATGKKLSMGGCCVRFRKLEDAALDVIGEAIRRVPAKAYIETYVKTLAKSGRGPDGKKLKAAPAAKKSAKATKSQQSTKQPSGKSPKKAAKR